MVMSTMITSTMLKTIVTTKLNTTTKFKRASAAIPATYVTSAAILATYVTSFALPETYVTSAALPETYVLLQLHFQRLMQLLIPQLIPRLIQTLL